MQVKHFGPRMDRFVVNANKKLFEPQQLGRRVGANNLPPSCLGGHRRPSYSSHSPLALGHRDTRRDGRTCRPSPRYLRKSPPAPAHVAAGTDPLGRQTPRAGPAPRGKPPRWHGADRAPRGCRLCTHGPELSSRRQRLMRQPPQGAHVPKLIPAARSRLGNSAPNCFRVQDHRQRRRAVSAGVQKNGTRSDVRNGPASRAHL